MANKPLVALVGRPNVGKSTLFNRLAGRRLAVIDDVPGTTRDRLHSNAEWSGVDYIVVDTGGIDPSHTKKNRDGEPLSIGSKDFIKEIREQAEIAIRDADCVLFLVDVEHGVTPADYEVANILRQYQKEDENGDFFPPVILVVNKCENKSRREDIFEFYSLGLGEPLAISSKHGSGVGDLLDEMLDALHLKARPADEEPEIDESIKIAIVGKPNAGKSSLLNRLLGEERAIVSPIPGTTRDAVDSFIMYDGHEVTLIDTAGIRRRGKIDRGVEKYSVIRALKAISRADVALLVVDAETGITAQDMHIAGFILDEYKSTVVIVNKWDSIEKDSYTMDQYRKNILNQLNFMDYVPILFISALTGQRTKQVLPKAIEIQEERMVRLSTSQVNKIIRNAIRKHPPPSFKGRLLKVFYGTQVRTDPPTFLIYVNDPEIMHFSFRRYLENQIREAYPFTGTPIRIIARARKKVKLEPRKKS